MKFVLILLLVLAFILAPIIALKPRGRQSRIEKLRLHARTQGASFSMRRLPPLKTETDLNAPIAIYSIPSGESLQLAPEWILRRTAYTHAVNFFNEWDWANEHRPPQAIQTFLLGQLESLPESVMAISAGANSIAFFWTEEGDQQTLERLIGLLNRIKDIYQQLFLPE